MPLGQKVLVITFYLMNSEKDTDQLKNKSIYGETTTFCRQ
jgi:hypothetical protein